MRRPSMSALTALALVAACGAPEAETIDDQVAGACPTAEGDDIFAATEACAEDPKADTGYVTNLDALEVELTLEADVVAPASELERAPLALGQFALTRFRQKDRIFIQSLAEDYANGDDQIEWKTSTGEWKAWSKLSAPQRQAAKRFRLLKVNAVILDASKKGVAMNKTFKAKVPMRPTTLFADVGNACEGGDGHIRASSDVYWYVWDPDKRGCSAPKQDAVATITNVLPKGKTVYPEYGKLYADKKLDAVVFFGQVDDGPVSETDSAFEIIEEFGRALTKAGFKKAASAPRGTRWTRTKSGITANIDVYTPYDFAGLTDYAHRHNFFEAVNSHEVIVFNGHSVLGASDFWAAPDIYRDPSKYQIFLYNGCLGYEYYVAPILAGKQGAANVDIVSNVVETPFAIVSDESAIVLSMLLARADKGGSSSWQTILSKMNKTAEYYEEIFGESFYGVSGARTNTYKPPR